MEKFEEISEKHKSPQQYFVYPLLFQEFLYLFAHDYGLNDSEPVEIVSCNNKKFSSLLVKRLIIRMCQQNFWINSIVYEGFPIVVEIPFSLQEFFCPKEKEIPKFQNLRSIHSIFSFLEDKFLHLHYLSHIEIPYPIHLEILMEHFGIMDPGFFWKTLWFFMDPLMHYVRYQGKAILASKGTLFLKKKWKCVPKSPLLVRNQTLENSFLIDTRMIKFDTIVSATLLIGSLSKAQFCTGSGHPISKPIWTELSNWDILDRFGQICKNLFHYHSGSSKKRNLYRLKYILRLSCARTLARKHKSTVRTFMQRLGSVFVEEFFTEEDPVFSLMFTKTTLFDFRGSHSERIWYLDIIRINGLVNPRN
ncbi:hypothetical protein BRADI_5g10956v3 [Brachypodium distachyon]|uniref:Maturase K n=1 Tax=Brachypodium distachyon TaxID=15368 RepID=A0A0Q3P280_BRADI|nr:hypothetical protein BRADI_5g10956v3 [Brachypodium distachyon]